MSVDNLQKYIVLLDLFFFTLVKYNPISFASEGSCAENHILFPVLWKVFQLLVSSNNFPVNIILTE